MFLSAFFWEDGPFGDVAFDFRYDESGFRYMFPGFFVVLHVEDVLRGAEVVFRLDDYWAYVVYCLKWCDVYLW